eukprot:TRINITY_DN98_c0_g1_i1.p1 TRINITY_DN98_c0_g1~~TRINITY_DN98_c0_g1_i1.p1  ORF type:complete len:272 (-),score=107.24 TRINITY_DN98_c0_g1_i1:546-1361(-)
MMSKIGLLVVLLGCVAAQPSSVFVKVTGIANSEIVEVAQQAVATAVAKIESACQEGDDINLEAAAQAKKVVEATATAVVGGGMYIMITGDGSGKAALAAEAESKATAIAEAIATAIAEIANGANVAVDTKSITAATESVKVAIAQQAEVNGEGSAIAVAAATATAFVSAVAEALAQAAAACDGEKGTVGAQVATASAELPSFADFTATFTQSAANIIGDGFSFVSNEATATSEGNTLPAVEFTGIRDEIVQPGSVVQDILCKLGLATTGCN